mgnify:FL=1
MVVTADTVLFLAGIERQWGEIDVAGADKGHCGQVLLEAFELGMHDVKFEQLGALQDMVEVLLRKWYDDLVVPALPGGVAAGIHDVRLEVSILADNVFEQLWDSESDESVGWLVLVDRIEQAHGRDHIHR